jgi:FG-GAP-like repeat
VNPADVYHGCASRRTYRFQAKGAVTLLKWLSRRETTHHSNTTGIETLEPRLLLSGTITAEFVAVDNSSALTGYNTYDLQVTATADWTVGALLLTVTQGTIYQDAFGGPNPQTIVYPGATPAVAFDTGVGGDAPSISIVGGAGDLGGDNLQFDETELDVSWFNSRTTDTGTFSIARITLSDDAVGTWSYTALSAPGDRAADTGNFTAGSLISAAPAPPVTPIDGDFNNDGKPDILWRNTSTNQTAIWSMDNTTYQSSSDLGNASTDPNWRPVGTGDFTGDDKTDTLWRNISDGRNYIAQTDNGVGGQQIDLPTVSSSRLIITGVADFTGDGQNDILWRNTRNGRNILWEMDGTTFHQKHVLKTLRNTSWKVGGTGDFNGDGKTDILWRNSRDGRNTVWNLNDTAFAGSTRIKSVKKLAWQIAQVADYNGDGKDDILWRNTGTGANTIWRMDGYTLQGADSIPSRSDQNWQIAGPMLGLWEA